MTGPTGGARRTHRAQVEPGANQAGPQRCAGGGLLGSDPLLLQGGRGRVVDVFYRGHVQLREMAV